jgi:hypothetical protein
MHCNKLLPKGRCSGGWKIFQSDRPSVIVEDHFGIQALWLHMQPKEFMVGVKEAHGQVQQI